MTTPYTPTTAQVRAFWASDGAHQPAAKSYDFAEGRAEFNRWLERIETAAARRALSDLAGHIDDRASQWVGAPVGSSKARDVRDWRDEHYPEETP